MNAALPRKLRRLLADGLLMINRLVSSDRLSRRASNGSALVFAPHPDDEVLGCGGVIALKAQAGARVQVVVMTDGRASHKTLIDADELVKIRRAEAQAAGRELGLAVRYVFLDFEDHRLAEHDACACDRAAEIIEQFKPDEIYVPSRRDGISDHTETNRIVRHAVERVGKPVTVLEYPVWLWNGWPWTSDGARRPTGIMRGALQVARDVAEIVLACRTRVDVGTVLHRKRAALAAYRSQLQRPNGDPRWPVLADVAGGEFLRRFETGVEIFRRVERRGMEPKMGADERR
jgi:LmbE family N-acetylglucosaminyl deacetylase